MLNARQLDLAMLFDTGTARRWSVLPLLKEKLYCIRSRQGLGSGEPDGQHEDTSIDRLVWPVFHDKHSVSRN